MQKTAFIDGASTLPLLATAVLGTLAAQKYGGAAAKKVMGLASTGKRRLFKSIDDIASLSDYNTKAMTGGFLNKPEQVKALQTAIADVSTAVNRGEASHQTLTQLLREFDAVNSGGQGGALATAGQWAKDNPFATAIGAAIPVTALLQYQSK